jgi:membrane fusion protein (multidrug efflux system)
MSAEVAATELGHARRRRARWRWALMSLGVVVVAVGALIAWLTGGRVVSTDDAYVQAARSTISSNVTGQVASIAVKDNQRVHRGDVLFQLDDAPFRIAVEEARAKMASVDLQLDAGVAAYQQQVALLKSAEDNVVLQQKEFDRIAALRKSGIATASQYDQAEHTLVAARQQVASLKQQAASVKALLGQFPRRSEHPMMMQLQAELDRAELNLSYTTIRAPDDGIVTKVEQLQVGDTVSAGAPVFALVSTRDVWVEANFKENQLTYMRTGQPATVEVDTYRGHKFKARVVSLAPGTGSQFTALPPENATGNWVKVVQRLPVRLELERPAAELPMHSGLSATVKVDTGHKRTLSGLFAWR